MWWIIYAISAAIIWGLDYALSERILQTKFSPITLLLTQMIAGTMMIFLVLPRTQLKADWEIVSKNPKLALLVLFVTITFNVGNLLIFLSIRDKNATLAGLIELSYPLFTAFFTWILFHTNHLGPNVIIGSILIFSGLIVLTAFG